MKPRYIRFATVLSATLLAAATAGAEPGGWQAPESIRSAAEAYARSHLGRGSETRVESAGVDARLKLPQCAAALETRAHGAVTPGRTTVAVSCNAPSRWQIFVPVRVFRAVDVVIAHRTIGAGELIRRDAVQIEQRSSAGLPHLYAGTLAAVVGQRARHTIGAGSVIQTTALNVLKAVERGAIVTLKTTRAGIAVHGEGRALEEGAIGERIRLKTAAGRIVEGTVESDSEVRVGG